jgi:hypothetical protein
MPLQVVLDRGFNGVPAPLEGADEDWNTGMNAAGEIAARMGPGYTAIDYMREKMAGGALVAHDDAVKQLQAQGYNTDEVPKEGLTSGALDIIKERQSQIRSDQSIASRANLGTASRFVAGIAGGVTDPSSLLFVLAPEATPARAGILARASIGAAEGGAYTGGALAVSEGLGHPLGDDDVTTQENLRQVLFGAVGGAAFALPRRHPVTTNEIAALERTQAYAAAHGLSPDEVVSSAGAVGLHQIEPATAKAFGYSAEDLKDPVKNREVAQKVLDQLSARYKNDPEAVAVAYNAGPKRADAWIKAGRDDSILPKETRGYVERLREMRGIQAYHGTNADFTAYDLSKAGAFSGGAKDSQLATFFTDEPAVAAGYAQRAAASGEGANIRPVSLHMENPKEIDLGGQMYPDFASYIQDAKQGGYDGAIFRNVVDDVRPGKQQPSTIYALFNPNEAARPAFAEAHEQLSRVTSDALANRLPASVDALPLKVRNDTASAAIVQLSQDSPVNVAPVLEQSWRDTHPQYAAALDLARPERAPDVRAAIPRPAASFSGNPDALARIRDVNRAARQTPGPVPAGALAEEAGQRADAAVKEAQQIFPRMGEPIPADFQMQMAEHDMAIRDADEFRRAVEAAVRCGMMKGLE